MSEISHTGAVNVAYSHFPVGELWEPGFERKESKPDFRSDKPVIVVPGQIVMRTRVQEHTALVVLALSHRQNEGPGETWTLLASEHYGPVYTGRMAVFDTMNGPAKPAEAPIEVFGRLSEPGEASLALDPSRTYGVQAWAQGRADSRERFEAASRRDEDGLHGWYEAYAIVFTPSGRQTPPAPALPVSRREQLAARHGKPPLGMR
ncbi:hypothetical protein [Streptomyces avermitilis]|uniref:hypothetical protein n=1 Tax=Streptomyces avermitilis TaxID=33903 RepID=UPI0033A1F6DB